MGSRVQGRVHRTWGTRDAFGLYLGRPVLYEQATYKVRAMFSRSPGYAQIALMRFKFPGVALSVILASSLAFHVGEQLRLCKRIIASVLRN